MKRTLVLLIIVASAVGFGAFAFLKLAANGFSARDEPISIEKFAARAARSLAMPGIAKSRQNPVSKSAEVLAEAQEHWADHCASCHANNGNGDTEMGRNMYPRAPDMRKDETQKLTDGELFFIIENGIRLTGMPAWGTGSAKSEQASWKLVHFIRHLPQVSDDEERQMQKMNPKSAADLQEEKEEEEFLKGNNPNAKQKKHSQH